MYEFIWDGKPEKIKRDILTMGYESLKMIDLDKIYKFAKNKFGKTNDGS